MRVRLAPNVIAFAAMALISVASAAGAQAKPIRVDVARDKVGSEPSTFIPMVGNWVVADEEGKKVVMVDGREWKRGQPAGRPR